MLTSPLALEDLQDLRAEGLTPSDEDVIRLHLLALKISDGPQVTCYNHPRYALAGGVVFHEPTAGAMEWYNYARQFAADDAMDGWMFAFACANGRKRGFLNTLRDPVEIEKSMGEFISSMAATWDEVLGALAFCAEGNGNAEPAVTELGKEHAKNAPDKTERELRNFSNLQKTLARAAASTGFALDDLLIQTKSQLDGYILAAHVRAGIPLTPDAARAHVDYLATLKEIRARLEKERDEAAAATATETPAPDNG